MTFLHLSSLYWHTLLPKHLPLETVSSAQYVSLPRKCSPIQPLHMFYLLRLPNSIFVSFRFYIPWITDDDALFEPKALGGETFETLRVLQRSTQGDHPQNATMSSSSHASSPGISAQPSSSSWLLQFPGSSPQPSSPAKKRSVHDANSASTLIRPEPTKPTINNQHASDTTSSPAETTALKKGKKGRP